MTKRKKKPALPPKEFTTAIQYLKLAHLTGAKRNPKTHATEVIAESISRFGYVEPVVIDERTDLLVAGHGRIETLHQLEATKAPPPPGIRVAEDGAWMVPVVTGWASRDDDEAEAYLLASNRTSQIGGWDEAALGRMLGDLNAVDALAGVGFDADALAKYLNVPEVAPEPAPLEPDEVPDLPAESWVKRGDLFQLGSHRLLCGDSTQREEVARLMEESKASLLCTDPPYGVNFTNSKGNIAADMNYGVIPGFFGLACDNVHEGRAVLFFGAETNYTLYAALFGRELRMTPKLMFWAKPQFILRHHDYHSQFECIFYGWTPGGDAKTRWKGDRKQSDVWDVPYDVTHANKVHITQKPVELFARAMRNHTEPGEICLEPFSGSGSQIIAGEKEGRRVFAMEIDPRYAQVTVERWERVTGQKAVKLGDAASVAKVANDATEAEA